MTVRCRRPDTVAEACHDLADGGWGAKVMAGGTALMLMMKEGLVAPDLLVSLDRVSDPGLRDITLVAGHLHIGGLVSLTEVAASPLVRAHAPVLADACRSVGNVRIRNVATLGGNLAEADYASDPPSVLVALGAEVVVQGLEGERRTSVAELITGFYTTTLATTEVVVAVRVPATTGEATATYTKFRSRSSEDRPCVGVAALATWRHLSIDRLTVVLGAVAATPFVVPHLDEIVPGTGLDDAVVDAVVDQVVGTVDPMEDHRGTAWYRRRVSGVLVRRTLQGLRDQRHAAVA